MATRTGDGTAQSPYVTHIVNQSFVDRLEWGFGLNLPLAPTVSSAAGTSFYPGSYSGTYTGTASNRFTVQTTGYPAARLTASGPGDEGALPAGVSFTDN